MYTLGIDVGTASAKMVALADGGVAWRGYELHRGAPRASLSRLLESLDGALGLEDCAGWMATGQGVPALRGALPAKHAPVLRDVPAITSGARLLAPGAGSVIAIGGQTAYFITGVSGGGAPRFAQNESCAAGTGSFFEDQMERLGLSIEDYSGLVAGARSVPRLSGRCAVFAKTDIIHRQQEGVDIRDILLGLCHALARSYKATIVRGLPVTPPVVLAGGVARNAGMERAVREVFGLEGDQLATDGDFAYLQAAGAAAEAARGAGLPARADACSLMRLRDALGRPSPAAADLPRLPPLPPIARHPGCGYRAHPRPWPVGADGRTPCFLGVDVGSTSTNLVLVDAAGRLLDAQYLRTRGDAEAAVRAGLDSLGARLGDAVQVLACAATGSGRARMGKLVGADVVRDEITAQARAAVAADARADTVFEIGGQDSKYVSLHAGQVADFQMNRICAAGTGSFVEEQAARLGIPLGEYGDVALASRAPVDLGERCTVFVETAINAALAKGASLPDVAAGLAYSVVRNYLHKVVGAKPVGRRVVLQGGVAYNPAIVAAFSAQYGDRLTVSPWFAVSGAVGAALLASEAYDAGEVPRTAFRGFDLSGAACRGERADAREVQRNLAFYRRTRDLLTQGRTGARDPAKQTVGIPRAMLMYRFFPLANAFFTQLGYNVLLSGETDGDVVRRAQESAQGEVCFPVKLLHGHMRALVEEGVDYIFMPRVRTIRHAGSHVAHNFACPYMQVAPQLALRGLDLGSHGVELLSPELDLDMGQEGMAGAMLGVGAQLGASPRQAARALMAGGFAVGEMDRQAEELGDALLAAASPGERVIVLVTRQYGIYDAVLSQGIAEELIRRGRKVATVSNLRAHDLPVGRDHPGMCWPFGQHLVAAAKIIRRDPRLFMVYLTNHGCGPDTMLAHLMAEEMGDKPYLHIEVDEHASKVGVVTRIEAFLNALDRYAPPAGEGEPPLHAKGYRGVNALLGRDGRTLFLPGYGEHSRLLAGWLEGRGHRVRLMDPDAGAIARGHDLGISKEYLSFTALAGMSLRAVERAGSAGGGGGGAPGGIRLVLPSSVGAEPDAVYDRVIRGMLDERGHGDVAISAFQLERLPWNVDDAQALFDLLLEGDARYAAEAAGTRRVAVVGEWPIVYGDSLASGAWEALADRDVRVERMPLAEYLLFLWLDCLEDDRRVQPGAARALGGDEAHRARRALLDGFGRQMADAAARLGDASPYDDFAALRHAADALMGNYRGANGRYRAAKAHLASRRVDGVVTAASMYENTQLVLNLKAADAASPVLNLSFDGALDQALQERLDSFLYYL